MANRLKDLTVDEVSGVDSPANELEGWLVMKSKDELTEILQTVEEVSKQATLTWAALDAASDLLEDAPDEVKTAAATLVKHLEAMLADEDAEDDKPTLKSRVLALINGKPVEKTDTEPDTEPDTTEPEPAPEAGEETDTEPDTEDKEDEPEAEADDAEDKDEPEDEEDEPEAAPEPDAAVTKTLDDLKDKIEKDGEATREVLSAMLDRISNVEAQQVGRQGLGGQETKKSAKPTLGDAMDGALRGRRVTLS